MNSDKKNESITSIGKNKQSLSTDTELHLELLADPSKLKPISRVINVDNSINSDDSHIVDKASLYDDSDVKSNSSSDRVKTSVKKISTKSEKKKSDSSSDSSDTESSKKTSSKSSRSSRSSTSKKVKSEAHKKIDAYANNYNKKYSQATENDERNEVNQINQEKTIPSTYLPKLQTEKEIRFRKMQLLFVLRNIKEHGKKLTREYDINSDLEDMEMEVRFHTDAEAKKTSVAFAKDGLLKATQFIEILNNNFDPFGINLKGWHNQMSLNADNYEDVFEELYDKYKDKIGRVEPEYRLVYMIFASAASFHYSKQLVEQMGIEKVIEKNPELFHKIQANIASYMEKNIDKKEVKVEKDIQVSQQEMYTKMLKEKEELEKKLMEAQTKNIINQNQNSVNKMPTNNVSVNDTISKMMSIQNQQNASGSLNYNSNLSNSNLGNSNLGNSQINNLNVKKPSQISELINKLKTNQSKELLTLDNTETSTSRIKVTNTVDTESVNDSVDAPKMRKSRRQRARINN